MIHICFSALLGRASDRLQRDKLNLAGFFRDKFGEKLADLMGFLREFSG